MIIVSRFYDMCQFCGDTKGKPYGYSSISILAIAIKIAGSKFECS